MRNAKTKSKTGAEDMALTRLYRAAFVFWEDRSHFAPGQFTMFVPREGTAHYAEHKALTDAALEYAATRRKPKVK